MMRPAIAVALLLAACETLPAPRYEGQHIRIATSPELELCAGTLAHMDTFIARLSAEFGVEPPTGDARYNFYWLTDEDFIDLSPCPREVTGCVVIDNVYSRAAPIDHELVHLFAYDTSSFFAEGIAVAYEGLDGGVEGARAARPASRDVWSAIDLVLWYRLNYDTAGAFVAYLLDRHGMPAVRAALPKVPLLPSRARLDGVFRDEFGVSLAESVADFMAERERCPHVAYDRKIMECGAPTIAWDGVHHADYRRLAADEPDVVGPYDGDALLVLHTLDVPAEAEYELQIVADPLADTLSIVSGVAVSLVACGGCDDDPVTFDTASRGRVTLRPGRHALRLHGDARIDTRIAWSITRIDDHSPR